MYNLCILGPNFELCEGDPFLTDHSGGIFDMYQKTWCVVHSERELNVASDCAYFFDWTALSPSEFKLYVAESFFEMRDCVTAFQTKHPEYPLETTIFSKDWNGFLHGNIVVRVV